jgi:hypothetical protein
MKTKKTLPLLLILSMLIPAHSYSQIHYVDIADTTLKFIPQLCPADTTNNMSFDINADALMDLNFLARHWTTFVSPSNPCQPGHYIRSESMNNQSMIASVNPVCPTLFSANDTINDSLDWRSYSDAFVFAYMATYPCGIPYNDVFYGLKFLFNSQPFFGWIRVDVTDSSLTIKDYAYNTVPNSMILAGQTVAGIPGASSAEHLQIFVSNDQLIIRNANLNDLINKIEIYTPEGRLVMNRNLNNSEAYFDLPDISRGLYLVKILSNTRVFTRKIIY